MEKLIAMLDNQYGEYHYEFEVDNEVVGECCVCRDNYIHSLCIYPQFQNRGYARMMLRAVFQLFAGQRMWLRAYAHNIPAIKAYTAVGFNTFKVDEYEARYSEPAYKVANMEVIAPAKSPVMTRKVYGLAYDEEEYSFDNESDRNEFALSLWQEHSHALWARTVNWYEIDADDEWEIEKAEEDAAENVMTFEVIHVEG